MRKHGIALFLFVVLFSQLQAQGDFRNGYIVTSSGDSISGLVDYRSHKLNSKYCFFKANKKTKKKRYTPNELKAYGYYFDKRYESHKLPNTTDNTHFVEILIEGHLSLMQLRSTYYLKTDTIILLPPPNKNKLIKTDKGIFAQDDNRYKGILNIVLTDCNLVGDQAKYNANDLVNLTQNYNRCKGKPGLVYKANKKKTALDPFIYTGLDFSNLTVDGFADDAFRKSVTSLYGIGLNISAPRIFDRLFFTTEFQYLKKRYQGFNGGKNVFTDYFIDISFLKVPISIRYNFFQDSNTPFVRFGFSQYFDLNSSLEIIQEKSSGSIVSTTTSTTELDSRNQSGFWVGLGYTKILTGRYKLVLEGRYERANGFLGNAISPVSNTTSTSIIFGLRF